MRRGPFAASRDFARPRDINSSRPFYRDTFDRHVLEGDEMATAGRLDDYCDILGPATIVGRGQAPPQEKERLLRRVRRVGPAYPGRLGTIFGGVAPRASPAAPPVVSSGGGCRGLCRGRASPALGGAL